MTFTDEINEAAADIAAQLADVTVTVTNPASDAAGTLDTATGTRTGTPAASTFNAHRSGDADERGGGERGSRVRTRTYTAEAAAVAAGGTLAAGDIRPDAVLTDGGEEWTVTAVSINGGLVEIRCRARL